MERPLEELKGFARVHLAAGEEKSVTLKLPARELAYWDESAHAWRVEQEKVEVLAGGASDNLPVKAELTVAKSAEFKP